MVLPASLENAGRETEKRKSTYREKNTRREKNTVLDAISTHIDAYTDRQFETATDRHPKIQLKDLLSNKNSYPYLSNVQRSVCEATVQEIYISNETNTSNLKASIHMKRREDTHSISRHHNIKTTTKKLVITSKGRASFLDTQVYSPRTSRLAMIDL